MIKVKSKILFCLLRQKKIPVAMPTVVVTREHVIFVVVPYTCLPLISATLYDPQCKVWVNLMTKLSSFFFFPLSLYRKQ